MKNLVPIGLTEIHPNGKYILSMEQHCRFEDIDKFLSLVTGQQLIDYLRSEFDEENDYPVDRDLLEHIDVDCSEENDIDVYPLYNKEINELDDIITVQKRSPQTKNFTNEIEKIVGHTFGYAFNDKRKIGRRIKFTCVRSDINQKKIDKILNLSDNIIKAEYSKEDGRSGWSDGLCIHINCNARDVVYK